MKHLCEERCYDSQRGRSYYENTEYDLSDSDIEHLKKIGHYKRFTPLAAAKSEKEPDEGKGASKQKSSKAGKEKLEK